ncbi:MAG TPA: hypothetical protein DD381_11170 [Lentisphaeria bacterium]|nr:MAG: hypothetical protein A2X47_00430 [Lentisphaerae bacterium GWF2_38_69]HBM16889.1 hypothetical protein [Lentisphaeria bacterium]
MTASTKKPLISLRNVKKSYTSGEVTTEILHGINLEIFEGEITVILGASGSGKTTLLNIIGGIDRPSSGNCLFKENDLNKFTDKQLTNYRRENIGFVFQFYNLVPTLTAIENVQVSTELATNPMSPLEAIKIVSLEDRKNNFPSQLSGGQQQKVSIARAIAKNPSLILCDEPTGALDLETGRMVLKILYNLNHEHKRTIVIITHSNAVACMAHRVIHIGSGIITKNEENQNILRPEEISY